MKKLFSILILSVIAVFAFVSCNLGGTESDGLSMYVTGDPNYTSTKSVSTRSTNGTDGITTVLGGAKIVVTKVEMVILELKLDVDSSSLDSNVEDLEVGPFLFELPLDGSAAKLFDGIFVPATFYDELEIEVDAPESDPEYKTFFNENYPEWDNEHEVSIRVTGTYQFEDGAIEDFVYRQYDFNDDFEIEFDPPLHINGGATNIVLAIDVSTWFQNKDKNGLLDPRYPETFDESIVEANIEDSFEAFEDSLED